jgi:hypothetical protein
MGTGQIARWESWCYLLPRMNSRAEFPSDALSVPAGECSVGHGNASALFLVNMPACMCRKAWIASGRRRDGCPLCFYLLTLPETQNDHAAVVTGAPAALSHLYILVRGHNSAESV